MDSRSKLAELATGRATVAEDCRVAAWPYVGAQQASMADAFNLA